MMTAMGLILSGFALGFLVNMALAVAALAYPAWASLTGRVTVKRPIMFAIFMPVLVLVVAVIVWWVISLRDQPPLLLLFFGNAVVLIISMALTHAFTGGFGDYD